MEPLATEKKELQPVLEVLKSYQTSGFLHYYMLDSATHPWYIPAPSQFL